MESQEIPKSEIIDQLIEWIYSIGAMRAALDLQIWEKIAHGEDTAEKMASVEGWDLIGTRVLLDMICTIKLLCKDGERYLLVPESSYYLIPGKPSYKGALPQSEFNWEGNGRLADSIRSGKRPIHYDVTKSDILSLWLADYSRRWVYPENYFEIDAKVWETLDIQAREGLRVLDLACGPAPISMALARQHPGVRLTWLDWQPILQTALQVAAKLHIENQVSLLPGNLWSVDFGHSLFDVIYLGNVTHFFGPEENTRLFQKVNDALVTGGIIVVNSVVRREKEEMASAALWLYATSASGGTYDFSEYKAMLENAGFKNVLDINQGAIRAIKR